MELFTSNLSQLILSFHKACRIVYLSVVLFFLCLVTGAGILAGVQNSLKKNSQADKVKETKDVAATAINQMYVPLEKKGAEPVKKKPAKEKQVNKKKTQIMKISKVSFILGTSFSIVT